MWQDPIVIETRKLREQYAAQFNHDANAIFADILKHQQDTTRERVTFTPRKPGPIASDAV